MIVKMGGHWMLFSHAGRVLGQHRTKTDAKAQEYAIDLRKARAAGHRIPKRPRKR